MSRFTLRRPERTRFGRASRILLASSFVSSLGVFLVAPYLASHLVEDGSVSVQAAGIYLGLLYWCLTAGSVFGGVLTQRFGVKNVMTVGLLLRLPGYLFFLFPDSSIMLVIACITTGFGGALYFPSSKAALMALTPEADRLHALSVRNMCANSGVALGPVLGAGLIAVGSPTLLLVVAAIAFTALAAVNTTIPIDRPAITERIQLWSDLSSALKIPGVRTICFVSVAFGAVYIHFESTIPLQLTELGRTRLIVIVFLINAVVVVVTQFLAVRLLEASRIRTGTIIGFACYGLGFALFMLPVGAEMGWLAGVVLFSFGEVVVGLLLDYEIVKLAPDRSATVFGLSNLTNAVGGAGGAWAGGLLISGAGSSGAPLTWGVLALFSIVAGLLSAGLLSRADRAPRSVPLPDRKDVLQ
jgi:DHA1 family multidrug resistance protein-like MFS transporter